MELNLDAKQITLAVDALLMAAKQYDRLADTADRVTPGSETEKDNLAFISNKLRDNAQTAREIAQEIQDNA